MNKTYFIKVLVKDDVTNLDEIEENLYDLGASDIELVEIYEE